MGAHAAAPHQGNAHAVSLVDLFHFLVSMSPFEIHCARQCAMITATFMFLMRRSMREASRLKLQSVPEHLYFPTFLGTPLLQFIC